MQVKVNLKNGNVYLYNNVEYFENATELGELMVKCKGIIAEAVMMNTIERIEIFM